MKSARLVRDVTLAALVAAGGLGTVACGGERARPAVALPASSDSAKDPHPKGSPHGDGGVWGDAIGDAFGVGGLDLVGAGEGGGGRGQGVCLCDAPAVGSGTAMVRQGSVTVSGSLPQEVVQRIVRTNFPAFGACYETGLQRSRALSGRITVRSRIVRSGATQATSHDPFRTDLADQEVIACVIRSFEKLSFPPPEERGGSVEIVYPLLFTPD